MSRARELTMGTRRRTRDGYTTTLTGFTMAATPDLDAYGAYLDRVARSPRALTRREGAALTLARQRFEQLTGQQTAGPADLGLYPGGADHVRTAKRPSA